MDILDRIDVAKKVEKRIKQTDAAKRIVKYLSDEEEAQKPKKVSEPKELTPEEKGYEFEKYIGNLFHEYEFEVLHLTPPPDALGGRKIKSKEKPDYQIKDKKSCEKFWVECKFRTTLFDDRIEWAKSWQFQRYRDHESDTGEPHFVIIGFKGEPNNPERMFCIPLKNIKYTGLFPGSIREFERRPNKEFTYLECKLI